MKSSYAAAYTDALQHPEQFWAEAAEDVHWYQKWERILDDSRKPFYRWFTGGVLNSCYNALDLHIENGRADQTALIYDSPVTGVIQCFTYEALRDEVARFAGVLQGQEVVKGDRVLIYMPMVPEAVIAMLACARIGAIHSVVFGGFAPNELAARIDDAQPRVIVSASCGIEADRVIPYKPLLDQAILASEAKPECCIILQRPQASAPLVQGRDRDWSELMTQAQPVDCVPVAATDPLYILYTSGTTGAPKGVVRDTGGHLVALKWSMKNVYAVDEGETYWAASDLGWAVGHSYIVYAPLFHGCTTILYEGKPVGTPDAGAFWRVVSQHGVNVLFTAPTVFRAVKREDPEGLEIRKYTMDCFRTLFLAGERCDPDTLLWAREKLQVPVIDHWWQTETGWPVGSNCLGLTEFPVKPGSCTKAVPGFDIRVLDDEGQAVGSDRIGNVVLKLPLPPGCLPTLWNDDEGFQNAYLTTYPGYYMTSDAGYKDGDDYLWIMGRTDDIINVAGHRLSTGAMEEVLASHSDIAECAVVGIEDPIKGEVPLGFVVLKSGVERTSEEIASELLQRVRKEIGPIASLKAALIVERLPKTRSGKILRGTMKRIADGSTYKVPATIDDPVILEEIGLAIERLFQSGRSKAQEKPPGSGPS